MPHEQTRSSVQEAGLIERPLPAQSPLPAKPNMMGCCSIQCGDSDRDGGGGILPATAPSAAFADTPAGVDSGAVLSSEVGQDASEGGGGDEGLSLNSRAGVGLAAAALVIAALALVAVVAYAVRLRQRRRRQLEWRTNKRQMSAAAEADPVEGLEVSTPRSMVRTLLLPVPVRAAPASIRQLPCLTWDCMRPDAKPHSMLLVRAAEFGLVTAAAGHRSSDAYQAGGMYSQQLRIFRLWWTSVQQQEQGYGRG